MRVLSPRHRRLLGGVVTVLLRAAAFGTFPTVTHADPNQDVLLLNLINQDRQSNGLRS